MEGNNNDLLIDATRILILTSFFEKKGLIIDKIMLYDFYMKFPSTMIEEKKESFYEYYSFFHWKPDRETYQKLLNYLLAKRLIDREIIDKKFHYKISVRGIELTEKLQSEYAIKLSVIGKYINNTISKRSDSQVELEIINKSSAKGNL